MAYESLTTTDLSTAPQLGTLPVAVNVVKSYDINNALSQHVQQVDLTKVSEFQIYVFFTGLPNPSAQALKRGVYELYTQPTRQGPPYRYSKFMNVVFDQKDTVINSANLWFPLTSDGYLHACLPELWTTGGAVPDDVHEAVQAAADCQPKNVSEVMQEYADGTREVFLDLFLTGYRLKN